MQTILSASLFIIATLFCLKILSNLSVPYVLAFQYLKSQGQDKSGISLMLEVENALWLLLLLLSCVSNGSTWLDEPKNVIIWGLGATLTSYIHFYAVAVAAGTKVFSSVSMWFKQPKSPRTHQTPFGEFTWKNGVWEGYIEVDGEEVRVTTNDVSGQPNPKLLHITPLIQQHLSHFESIARQSVETLSPQHEFDSVDISSIHPETNFSLIFVCSDETWSGTIHVELKDNKITGWWGSG